MLLLRIPLKECAARLGISYATVLKYAAEPEFLGSLRLLSESIHDDLLKELTVKKKSLAELMTEKSQRALERLAELMDSQQEGIALKACDSVLDRVSETARNRKLETDLTGRFTIDPMMLIHAAATAQELDTVNRKSLPPFERDGAEEAQ
jgi:hypothetical protein